VGGHPLFDVWELVAGAEEITTRGTAHACDRNRDGTARAQSVRGRRTAKDSGQPKSCPLIVHGRGGVRPELSDEVQVKLAARLMRELRWE